MKALLEICFVEKVFHSLKHEKLGPAVGPPGFEPGIFAASSDIFVE
jgi:hypothetical protein